MREDKVLDNSTQAAAVFSSTKKLLTQRGWRHHYTETITLYECKVLFSNLEHQQNCKLQHLITNNFLHHPEDHSVDFSVWPVVLLLTRCSLRSVMLSVSNVSSSWKNDFMN